MTGESQDPAKLSQALMREISSLKGELLATQVAIRGLLLAQPDPDAAIAAVTEQLERFAAFGLNSEVPDSVLDGFQKARSRLFPSARDLGEAG